MTGQRYSSFLAAQILERFRERQDHIEAFIRALVEIETPSGDLEGSREVVAALSATGGRVSGVHTIETAEVPGFGEQLVIKAFQEQTWASQIWKGRHTGTVHSRASCWPAP